MNMGEDARDFIINLIPFMLRVSLEIVYVDEKNRGSQEMQNQLYNAKTTDFYFSLNDSLNLHEKTLYLFLKTGHYDIIYKKNWVENFDQLIKRDLHLEFVQTQNTFKNKSINLEDLEKMN